MLLIEMKSMIGIKIWKAIIMTEVADCINDIKNTLHDAGCTDDFINQFILAFQQNNKKNQQKLLNQHKRSLNEKIFQKQKQIDCLDYLCFKLNS